MYFTSGANVRTRRSRVRRSFVALYSRHRARLSSDDIRRRGAAVVAIGTDAPCELGERGRTADCGTVEVSETHGRLRIPDSGDWTCVHASIVRVPRSDEHLSKAAQLRAPNLHTRGNPARG